MTTDQSRPTTAQDLETLKEAILRSQRGREERVNALRALSRLEAALREKDEALEREAGARADLRQQLTESQEQEALLRLALQEIADPVIHDADWRTMREVAEAALTDRQEI